MFHTVGDLADAPPPPGQDEERRKGREKRKKELKEGSVRKTLGVEHRTGCWERKEARGGSVLDFGGRQK